MGFLIFLIFLVLYFGAISFEQKLTRIAEAIEKLRK